MRTIFGPVLLLGLVLPALAQEKAKVAVGAKAPAPENKHHIGLSVGQTIAEGSEPFGGGGAFRIFGGTRVWKNVSLEFATAYTDFFSRGEQANAGAILTFSLEARFEVPVAGEWLRFYGRGGGHYSLGLLLHRALGGPDYRDRVKGPGFVLGGGLRVRLWRDPKTGTSMFLGAEFASLWVFQTAQSDLGPTVMNSLALPVSIDW
jgi:hypothetical protein